ncbi:hypothetical protein SETIT_1G241600v2 [Setaria italica]|uniref:Ubiquitin-like domain-containing protein n=2 Tax=Setaria italica TaxID=4555 RepID=A0A368PPI2_SETIT|nr:hypothetical protein SETIT_1G241600v2 [Setaria italica]
MGTISGGAHNSLEPSPLSRGPSEPTYQPLIRTPRSLGGIYRETHVSSPSPSAAAAGRRRAWGAKMIEVVLNDRLGKKVRVKCNEDDTIGDLKRLVAAQTGTRAEKIRIQKWYTIYKDHITLADYEIHDGMGLELYYN